MERDHQETNTFLTHVNAKEECSPTKPPGGGGGGGGGVCVGGGVGVCVGGDRIKRDEWSEGAVASLLEVYEAKWTLRNRAKLKGQDWEDVASHVSSRVCSSKTSKTPTQCKNKIESMKKRYRAESTSADHVSSWPLFSRLHRLLGGACGVSALPPPPPPPPQPSPPPAVEPTKNQSLALIVGAQTQTQTPLTVEIAQNSPHSVGPQQLPKEDKVDINEGKVSDQVSDGGQSPMAMDTDSTPALYGCKDRKSKSNGKMKMKMAMEKRKRRRRMSSNGDAEIVIAESIQWLAEAVVKTEQVRMETTRELEKMRTDAEARRAETDLKRTEIIANTQLEIARIFAECASSGSKSVGSSANIRKN